MNSWLRLWHDMPTDPKFRTVSKISNQPLTSVLSVYIFLLVDASQNTERGVTQCDAENVASALDLEIDQIHAIFDAMQGRLLEGYKLTGWDRRQPKREDNSSERTKTWRENKKSVTQCDAMKRTVTLDKDKDTDKEEDKEKLYKKKIRVQKNGCVLPVQFMVNDEHREYAYKNGLPDPDHEIEGFKNYHCAKGSIFKNWDAAFRNWLINAKKFNGEKNEHYGNQKSKSKSASHFELCGGLELFGNLPPGAIIEIPDRLDFQGEARREAERAAKIAAGDG